MILKKGLSDKDKAEALLREFGRLREERRDFEPDWDKAQAMVSSVTLRFQAAAEDDSARRYELPKRITSRPANYLSTLVSGICGYAVNQNILWQKLGLDDGGVLEDRYGVKDWLEDAETALYRQYARGGLYSQIPSLVRNAATYGDGIMLIEENAVEQRCRYQTVSNRECYLDVNEYDEVDTVFREYHMSLENAAAFFGADELHTDRRRDFLRAEGADRGRRFRVVHAVFKNRDGEGRNISHVFDYSSVYLDAENRHVMREGGYDDFPYAIFTWERVAGKKYGIGPALMALSDIRLLFKTEEAKLELAQFSARPPVNVPEMMRGKEQLVPAGRNYYKNGTEVISPIQMGTNFPITLEVTRDFEERVKDWFSVDFFLMLQRSSRQMTATEVAELQGEKAAVLSTMVNNLNRALEKVVQRSADILFRQGNMPEMPSALREEGPPMKVEFLGVLAQAQKRAHEVAGIMQAIGLMQGLAGVARMVPRMMDAFDYVKAGEILKKGLKAVGVSEKAIEEEDNVQELRRARAEAQEQEMRLRMMMEQQKQVAQNYDKLNEPVRPGTPLAAMSETGGTAE